MGGTAYQMHLSRQCIRASVKNRRLPARSMVKSKPIVRVLAGALVFGMPAYPHPSFESTYDLSKQVKVEGKLVQFLFRNPHSFVHIESADGQRWAIEWAGGAQLSGSSIDRT